MPGAFSVKPEAMHAWNQLGALLTDLDESGSTTPCQVDPAPFVSEDHAQRQEAAQACSACAVVAACRRFADANAEAAHVWGGIDRTHRPYSRKAPTA